MAYTNQTQKTNSIALNSNDMAINPKSILGKDDFLKLLLVELEYQDPTSPMDTDKILTQTSQLATLETQQNTNKTLKEITDGFKSSSNLEAIGAIGKYAKLNNKIRVVKGEITSFNINFEKEVKKGEIHIYDENNQLVKTIPIKEGSAGNTTISWDGKNDRGEVKEGFYKVEGTYIDKENKSHQIDFGTYPIEGVAFKNGEVEFKIANRYIPITQISEIFDKKEQK